MGQQPVPCHISLQLCFPSHRIFVLGIGFFTLCFLMTSLGGQFSAKRLGDSPFTIRTEGEPRCPSYPTGCSVPPRAWSSSDRHQGCREDGARLPPFPRHPPDLFQGCQDSLGSWWCFLP